MSTRLEGKRIEAQTDTQAAGDPDAEHELVVERVCAIDVAKASGKVCVRSPRQQRRISKVWDVEATGAATELAGQLAELGIEKVTIESTSDYCRVDARLATDVGIPAAA